MKLHDYQLIAVEHLQEHPRSGLFLDMDVKKCDRVNSMNICEACESPVVRDPDQRGRLPRLCKVCRFPACKWCGETFTVTHQGHVYCSTDCKNLAMSERNAREMGQPIESSYVYGEGGELVHRIVASAVLGRPLQSSEVVHHEDRDKQNNHPSNLIVFPTNSEHTKHHRRGHSGGNCDCTCIRLWEVML